jgi:hypothetical protein
MGLEQPEIGEDKPFNNPESAQVGSNEKWTVEFTPENTGTTFVLPELAVSKQSQTTYEVKLDGTSVYLSDIPPTDIDDSTQTWLPAKTFSSSLEVIVRNFASSTRTYHVQPKGWETSESPNGGA